MRPLQGRHRSRLLTVGSKAESLLHMSSVEQAAMLESWFRMARHTHVDYWSLVNYIFVCASLFADSRLKLLHVRAVTEAMPADWVLVEFLPEGSNHTGLCSALFCVGTPSNRSMENWKMRAAQVITLRRTCFQEQCYCSSLLSVMRFSNLQPCHVSASRALLDTVKVLCLLSDLGSLIHVSAFIISVTLFACNSSVIVEFKGVLLALEVVITEDSCPCSLTLVLEPLMFWLSCKSGKAGVQMHKQVVFSTLHEILGAWQEA
eukprot:6485439-Amphidinium_carterae.2